MLRGRGMLREPWTNIPYSPNPTSVPKFLDHIQEAGVPDKVTQQYLVSVGFRSKNHRPIIRILKALGFLNPSGGPTQTWKEYRNKAKAPVVLADAVRRGYPQLFQTYPDANRRDNEAIRNFFSTQSNLAEKTLALAVRTFKALCDKADFESAPEVHPGAEPPPPEPNHPAIPPVSVASSAPSININVELHLPPTDDASVYDKLFEAMRKHLFSDGDKS